MRPVPALPGEPVPILVAEDNRNDRLILDEAFSELEFHVRLAFVASGEELLDYLLRRNAYLHDAPETPPRLILLDLNMPRMNGMQVLRELRADPMLRALPVVVLSTSDNPQQIAAAYANGVNAFLTKPGPFEELVALLRRFGAFWLQGARLPELQELRETGR